MRQSLTARSWWCDLGVAPDTRHGEVRGVPPGRMSGHADARKGPTPHQCVPSVGRSCTAIEIRSGSLALASRLQAFSQPRTSQEPGLPPPSAPPCPLMINPRRQHPAWSVRTAGDGRFSHAGRVEALPGGGFPDSGAGVVPAPGVEGAGGTEGVGGMDEGGSADAGASADGMSAALPDLRVSEAEAPPVEETGGGGSGGGGGGGGGSQWEGQTPDEMAVKMLLSAIKTRVRRVSSAPHTAHSSSAPPNPHE